MWILNPGVGYEVAENGILLDELYVVNVLRGAPQVVPLTALYPIAALPEPKPIVGR